MHARYDLPAGVDNKSYDSKNDWCSSFSLFHSTDHPDSAVSEDAGIESHAVAMYVLYTNG
jgi:hypothetical protein